MQISERLDPSLNKNNVELSELEKTVLLWRNDLGDKNLRLDYNLNSESLVLDLGGYEGQWASDIFAKYQCKILIFEPVHNFYESIKKRFEKNSKITIYEYGLAASNGTIALSVEENASSAFKVGAQKEIVQLVSASQFFDEKDINHIDLIKINIEGGEYDLLDYLIKTEFVKNIDNIQVQFHKFVPEADSRREAIQKELSKSHYLTYEYPFIWENWTRNHNIY